MSYVFGHCLFVCFCVYGSFMIRGVFKRKEKRILGHMVKNDEDAYQLKIRHLLLFFQKKKFGKICLVR